MKDLESSFSFGSNRSSLYIVDVDMEVKNDFKPEDLEKYWQDTDEQLDPLKTFSVEERRDLEQIINAKASFGNERCSIPLCELVNAIQLILKKRDLSASPLFKSIDHANEFGISRYMADRVSRFPQLLAAPTLSRQGDTTTYILKGQTKDSNGNTIELERRFEATHEQEAWKIRDVLVGRLQGIEQKVWMACWKQANKTKSFTFTCELTELMQECYPERKAYFQASEKITFYEHLRSLEHTKLGYSRKVPTRKGKETMTFETRLLDIHTKVGEQEEYPREITLTILNSAALHNEKTAFLGAGMKNTTLELHADDTMLANAIQTRKSQRKDHDNQTWRRLDLIKLCGLEKTNDKNKTQANKQLLRKLQRLAEKGIIKDAPKSITDTITLTVA